METDSASLFTSPRSAFETSSEGWKLERIDSVRKTAFAFETSSEGWKHHVCGPAVLVQELSKLPLRDGNPPAACGRVKIVLSFETSSEGWKRTATPSRPSAPGPFETSSEGWKLAWGYCFQTLLPSFETSSEGWKRSRGRRGLSPRRSFRNFL